MSWGQCKMQRGDTRAALTLFERGLTLATENRERYQEVRALQYIALAHLEAGDPAEAALEMAKSSTEWARKMPMMGIVYGLTFQALALSRLGRHDEAIVRATIAAGRPYVQSGAARGIAALSSKRSPLAPDVPTMSEAGVPGLDVDSWLGLFAPARTPPDHRGAAPGYPRFVARLEKRFEKNWR